MPYDDRKTGLAGIIPTASTLAALQQASSTVSTNPLQDANENINPEAALTSAAPGSGGIAASGTTPAPEQSNSQPGVADSMGPPRQTPPTNQGNTQDWLHNKQRTDAEGLVNAATISAEKHNGKNLSQNQKAQLKETAKALGIDTSLKQFADEVYDELRQAHEAKKIPKKQYTKLKDRWKNIFNIIDEDEMPLFLIDFGMRAMMAGEGMGDLAAIGAAGSGALGALQGRRQMATEQDAALRKEAFETATGIYGAETDRMKAEADMMEAGQSALTETADGFIYRDDEGRWQYVTTTDAEGKEVRVKPPLSSANRPYAAQQLQAQLEASGFFTPQEVAILVSKQPGKGDVRNDALRAWERRMNEKIYPINPDTGRVYSTSEWKTLPDSVKNKHRAQFADDYVGEYMKAYGPVNTADGDAAAAQAALDASRE